MLAVAFSSRRNLSLLPGSSTPATDSDIPSAVSSAQAVQRPFGASEKIFAPHFRQSLITLIMVADLLEQSPIVLRKILRFLTPALKTRISPIYAKALAVTVLAQLRGHSCNSCLHEFTLIGSAVFVIIRGIRVEPSCNSCLRSDYRDEMAQFVFDIAGRCNCVSNFLSQ